MASAVGSRLLTKIPSEVFNSEQQYARLGPDVANMTEPFSGRGTTKDNTFTGIRTRQNTLEPLKRGQKEPFLTELITRTDTLLSKVSGKGRNTKILDPILVSAAKTDRRTIALKKGNSKYDVLPVIRATPGIQRQFTFTGYDIMDDVDSDNEVPTETVHSRNRKKYESTCRKLGIVPVSQMERHLAQPEIKLRSRGLGPKGTRALAVTLVGNDNVTALDISDNDSQVDGATCIADMLKTNHVLTELNIAENCIGAAGLKSLCRTLANNAHIRKLDISGNNLKDKGATYLSLLLQANRHLQVVKASHNQIGEEGGVSLGVAIAKNETLTSLDLSWNHLRGKGAVAISKGIKDNVGLRLLNLSWNGFGKEGSVALGNAMSVNTTLAELDVRANRLHTEGLAGLMKGVQDNQGIVYLKLGKNPISPQGAVLVLKAVSRMQSHQMKELDMDDVEVSPEFMELLNGLQEEDRSIKIKHGVLMKHIHDASGEEEGGYAHMDPRALLFSLLEKDGLRVIDLFMRLDEDNSQSVERDEFKTGIMESGMPITEAQLDKLVDLLDADGDGEVDLGELLAAEREYKRSLLIKKMKEKENNAQKQKSED